MNGIKCKALNRYRYNWISGAWDRLYMIENNYEALGPSWLCKWSIV